MASRISSRRMISEEAGNGVFGGVVENEPEYMNKI
jgi:hypothetical protein